jgi:hypothetical protein
VDQPVGSTNKGQHKSIPGDTTEVVKDSDSDAYEIWIFLTSVKLKKLPHCIRKNQKCGSNSDSSSGETIL